MLGLINAVFYAVGAVVTVSAFFCLILWCIIRLAYVHAEGGEIHQWTEDDL